MLKLLSRLFKKQDLTLHNKLLPPPTEIKLNALGVYMPIDNYVPSDYISKKNVQTSVSASAADALGSWYSFDVPVKVNNITQFVEEYAKHRTQLWKDWNYDNGVWKTQNDQGYQNLMMLIESGTYVLRTYEYESFHRVPAKGKCCGKWLSLHNFTNTCPKCYSDYNSSGQLLSHRSQWGEETGEHWSDCI